jgi:hypothetical protein
LGERGHGRRSALIGTAVKKIHNAACRLDDDVLSAIENNGEVTLPGVRRREPLFSRRQFRFVALVIGLLILRRTR